MPISIDRPVQDSGLRRYYGNIVSTLEREMDEPPDWRKTAFWRKSSFMQAWQMWKLRPPSVRMETEPELERLRCALLPSLIMASPAHACAC